MLDPLLRRKEERKKERKKGRKEGLDTLLSSDRALPPFALPTDDLVPAGLSARVRGWLGRPPRLPRPGPELKAVVKRHYTTDELLVSRALAARGSETSHIFTSLALTSVSLSVAISRLRHRRDA